MTQLASLFHKRFRGLERAYGTYLIQGSTPDSLKIKGQAKTLVGTVTDTLWLSHLKGIQSIGITPINDDSTVNWGCIDIDVYEGLDVGSIEKTIEKEKLPLIICRTKSGGAHIFLFTQEPVDAELVQGRLAMWASLLGHTTAEIFPKQTNLASHDDVGSWLNMPYFNEKNTTRYCVRRGEQLSAEEFLEYAEERATTADFLANYSVETDELLKGAPPCLMHIFRFEKCADKNRNNTMFNYSVYARKRFGEDWQEHARKVNLKYFKTPLDPKEIKTIFKSVSKKQYAYRCDVTSTKNACNKALCAKAEYGIGSDVLSGIFSDLIKIDTKPPLWFVTAAGKRITVEGTEDLLNIARLRVLLLDQANILVPRVKNDDWDAIVKKMIDAMETVEVPPDADDEGAFFEYVETFCTDSPRASEISDLLSGAVFKDDKFWYFRSRDLAKFFQVNRFNWDRRVTWSNLKKYQTESEEISVGNGKVITCWKIPANVFTDNTFVPEPRVPKNEF